MKLVLDVVRYLEQREVRTALIGGMALAARGIARATLDFDLLVTDRRALSAALWGEWTGPAVHIEHGDDDDPLAGVVRLHDPPELVDVVVGKDAWQVAIITRCDRIGVHGETLPVIRTADLILLKLFAGGPQDLLDIRLILSADDGQSRAEVESLLSDLPRTLGDVWRSLLMP